MLDLHCNPSQLVHKAACLLIFSLFLCCFHGFSQVAPLPHAYAHNDYWHKRPLLDALDNGFTHVEADVYLRHSRLVVSHNPPLFRRKPTIEELYLQPLLRRFDLARTEGPSALDTIVLMVDVKSRGRKTIRALDKLLQHYKPVLSSYENGKVNIRNLTVVVTGHRALNQLESEKVRFLFVDADLKNVNYQQNPTDLYMTASCKYSSLLRWKGKGRIPFSQQSHLMALINKAHALGAKVRLWNSPDNKSVWDFLIGCGVDLINTDKLIALRQYFTNAHESKDPPQKGDGSYLE